MLFNIITLLLLAGAGFLLYRMWRHGNGGATPGGPVSSPPATGRAEITHVGVGGVLGLKRVGPELRDEDIQVTARHSYRQGNFVWWELEADSPSGTVFLDIEEDDGLEMSITLEKLALDETDQTPEALSEMARSGRGQLHCRGENYRLTETGRATFLPSGDETRAENFTFWDLEAEDGDYDLSVECWEDGTYNVYLSQELNPEQVTIYSVGEPQ